MVERFHVSLMGVWPLWGSALRSPAYGAVATLSKDGFKKGARTQKRTLTLLPPLPNFGRWFIFANDLF
jgi:hypothetical protein